MSDGDGLWVDLWRLWPVQQEVLWMRAGGAISDGVGRAEAVRVFGVGPNLVRNWRCR